MPTTAYDHGLDRNSANHTALSPISFLKRSACVYPGRESLIHGDTRFTWAQTYARCRRLASALARRGVGVGDTVAAMRPNTPPMFEAHFGVPMLGAVLNTLNTRLDAEALAFILDHGETMGEIFFRGNLVMKGYLKNPQATAEAFAGGWFHTGDLAVLHPDGYVKIKDRSKDVIISGGESISSLEVEEVLYRHPAVMVAAVVAKPDDKWGEVPCAYVELCIGASVTEAEIIEHCRAQLARFKVPKQVLFGTLPKTSTGKIQKFVLREQLRSASAME